MSSADSTSLPPHHSTQNILAHPRFPEARTALVQAVLGLYENDAQLNRLLLEVGRNVLFVVILCLHARYDEADRKSWPTLRLVQQAMAGFGLASPRRVADLVARLIETGHLEQRRSPVDQRIRILTPTAKMIARDQDWLVYHYAPLQALFPEPGYAPIIQRDPSFQLKHRMVAVSMFPSSVRLLERNPLMLQFMRREAGMMILIKLIELAGPHLDATRQISYSDIGTRFGVSRTQVRKLLREAEALGLVHLTPGRSHFVRLTPKLLQAFDHFIADTMSAHDLSYQLACRVETT